MPQNEAVIFAVAPHANQFIDPMMVTTTCGRKIGFLAAKKSVDKPVIGTMIKMFNSIPVERPQDLAFNGKGLVYTSPNNPKVLYGKDTAFLTQLGPRYSISLSKTSGSVAVEKVVSDTEVILKSDFTTDEAIKILEAIDEYGVSLGSIYRVVPHVDQAKMFSAVTARLQDNECVGIFPEGGSHDRPDLLPLKPGVSMMALEALASNPNMKISIIPVGLNYYHADRFRSRAVVEYGDPIKIPIELVEQYLAGGTQKRNAVGLLLDTVSVAINNLTVQASDFETLMMLHACKRLYVSQKHKQDLDSSLEMTRRFAIGFEKLKDRPEIVALADEVIKYNTMLKYYGIKDHQVKNTSINPMKAIYMLIFRTLQLIVLGVLALPMLVLCSPLLYIAQSVSRSKMKEAKAGSSVKIAGKDVVSTWKLLTSLALTPLLWIVYTVIEAYLDSRVCNFQNFCRFRTCVFVRPDFFCSLPNYGLRDYYY